MQNDQETTGEVQWVNTADELPPEGVEVEVLNGG